MLKFPFGEQAPFVSEITTTDTIRKNLVNVSRLICHMAASEIIKIEILTKSDSRFIALSHFVIAYSTNSLCNYTTNPIVLVNLIQCNNSFTVNGFNKCPKQFRHSKIHTSKTMDQLLLFHLRTSLCMHTTSNVFGSIRCQQE